MNTSDLTLTVIIILIFILLYVFNILAVGIKKVEQDWPLYRCNPTIMPFASVFGHDTVSNFTYCIQNMQSNYMGFLFEPLHYNLGIIGSIATDITKNLSDVRAFFSNIRGFISDIVGGIFGVFLNILIEVQRLTMSIKDLFGKLTGIMATMMFTLSSSLMVMQSAWSGPPGELVRALCFHPETKLRLVDGTLVAMKDIMLNTVLRGGGRVCAVMSISNTDSSGGCIEQVYEVSGGEEGGGGGGGYIEGVSSILVSGSHLLYDAKTDEFSEVRDLAGKYPLNIRRSDVECKTFSCLITSNHVIPIGKWVFHDWEDNNGSVAKNLI